MGHGTDGNKEEGEGDEEGDEDEEDDAEEEEVEVEVEEGHDDRCVEDDFEDEPPLKQRWRRKN